MPASFALEAHGEGIVEIVESGPERSAYLDRRGLPGESTGIAQGLSEARKRLDKDIRIFGIDPCKDKVLIAAWRSPREICGCVKSHGPVDAKGSDSAALRASAATEAQKLGRKNDALFEAVTAERVRLKLGHT